MSPCATDNELQKKKEKRVERNGRLGERQFFFLEKPSGTFGIVYRFLFRERVNIFFFFFIFLKSSFLKHIFFKIFF